MQDLNNSINIRNIQHYLYCPHRWGLIEIGDSWAENYFVTKANMLHNRVHSTENSYFSKGKKVFTAVTVWLDSDKYNLYGVTDCIELIPDNKGTEYCGEKYRFCIVEYKPTKPKDKDYNFDDALQVYAQKKCVDAVFGCDCEAAIYYADVKKRIPLLFNANNKEFETSLDSVISEMKEYILKNQIPEIRKEQKCNGCSFADMCLPNAVCKSSVVSRIRKSINNEL